jgi:glycosyltransferase involved in cell wall biosynthesis
MTRPGSERRRGGASALRPPVAFGRCDRCLTPVLRRADAADADRGERLCGACSAGDRAVAQARGAERNVRTQLYDRRGAVAVLDGRGRRDAATAPPSERPLRIALLAPPWLPVPPTGYGGIETVVALLADALVERGHDVTLLAAPGSRGRARVLPLLDRLHPRQIGASVVEADHVARAFAHVEAEALGGQPYDVLHDHAGWIALAMADRLRVPVLHTVHGSFDEDASRFYAEHGRKAAISYISRAQAATRPEGLAVDAVVPNPIDVDAWPADVPKDDYLLWVGRFCPEKGPQRAIRVAKAAGRRLLLAGPVQPGQERFFAEAIEPHLDGDRIRWVGEVGGPAKQRLFAAAAALLMPIRWPEPFGMVMVEAMAAGTPVLAFAEGSVPELVEPGRSGLIVGDEEAMAAAVAEAARLDPEACRASARERFAPDRVAARYEAVYRAIATPSPPGASAPVRGEQAIAA